MSGGDRRRYGALVQCIENFVDKLQCERQQVGTADAPSRRLASHSARRLVKAGLVALHLRLPEEAAPSELEAKAYNPVALYLDEFFECLQTQGEVQRALGEAVDLSRATSGRCAEAGFVEPSEQRFELVERLKSTILEHATDNLVSASATCIYSIAHLCVPTDPPSDGSKGDGSGEGSGPDDEEDKESDDDSDDDDKSRSAEDELILREEEGESGSGSDDGSDDGSEEEEEESEAEESEGESGESDGEGGSEESGEKEATEARAPPSPSPHRRKRSRRCDDDSDDDEVAVLKLARAARGR
mgnify:CR=1 FL=1